MDYEKAYNDALERAKDCHVNKKFSELDDNAQELCEYIFPELKVNDEMIRKELINFIKKEASSATLNANRLKFKSMLVWLEKQCEQKPFDYEKAHIQQNEFVPKSALEAIKEEKVDNQNCIKSDDNVEPKFKVGDWVVHDMSDGRKVIAQIISMTNKSYILDGKDFNTFYFSDLENDYHLWTIQDAKEGDVLAYDNDNCPFIYKTKTVFGNPIAYCGVRSDGLFISESTEDHQWCLKSEVIPATKEQRDLLFQKMKEAGYEWDAEKKELKKIELNSAWSKEDENFFANINTIIDTDRNIMESGKRRCKDWLKSLKDRIQPKQEWSKEDEEFISILIERINQLYVVSEKLCKYEDRDRLDPKHKDWLIEKIKSLKPQPHWKPTEEQINALLDCVNLSTKENFFELNSLYEQLVKL